MKIDILMEYQHPPSPIVVKFRGSFHRIFRIQHHVEEVSLKHGKQSNLGSSNTSNSSWEIDQFLLAGPTPYWL
jgi:hypothetical protein